MTQRYEYARIENDKIIPGWNAVVTPNSIAILIPDRFWERSRAAGMVEADIEGLCEAMRDGLRRQLIKETK